MLRARSLHTRWLRDLKGRAKSELSNGGCEASKLVLAIIAASKVSSPAHAQLRLGLQCRLLLQARGARARMAGSWSSRGVAGRGHSFMGDVAGVLSMATKQLCAATRSGTLAVYKRASRPWLPQ